MFKKTTTLHSVLRLCLVFDIHWLGYRRKIDILQERIGVGSYTTIRLLLQPFLWLYTPEIHSKTALLNEWMDNGNKTFHLFLIIHDQTTNYVCLTKALCTTSSHREFWSEEAHCITISATDYQSSIKLILKNYHCSWWLLLYGPFIFFLTLFFVFSGGTSNTQNHDTFSINR